jgi:hypothetical protein
MVVGGENGRTSDEVRARLGATPFRLIAAGDRAASVREWVARGCRWVRSDALSGSDLNAAVGADECPPGRPRVAADGGIGPVVGNASRQR